MKLQIHHRLELTGLIIVLLATTFQLTLLSVVDDISNKSAFYRIETKINTIWYQMNGPVQDRGLYTSGERYFDSLTNSGDHVDKQQGLLSGIYAVVMLIGSSLLVLGRWLEMVGYKKK